MTGAVTYHDTFDSPMVDEVEICWFFGVILPGYVEGDREPTHSHPNSEGLRWLETDREWEVEIFPLVVGQLSVKEKEWLETFKLFGIGKEDGKKIIHRLGSTV